MRKNKLITIKMNKFKIFGLALFASVSFSHAQDINQAKTAIDAEQFEKAKSILKSIIQAKPSNGTASFLLGNVYLSQSVMDSAKIAFDKGLAGTEGAGLNYIGLGQMDLEKSDIASAQAKFALATKDMRKKDIQEFVYIARAYMNVSKPDYKSAIAILNRAVVKNPQDAQVQLALGDAYYGDGKQNEAYVAYRNAYQADSTMLRAKMQLGVLLKGAKSYDEALKAYNEVIALNPNYGPVYRELAETYYKIARNKPSKSEENLKTAIGYFEKYMTLTDYSIHSRMRRADFLILVKDYAALEAEANKMIELDKVNPRIFRYLGYAAYENGNVEVALKSLETFTTTPGNKVIAKDYLYLGLAKIKKGTSADGLSIDPAAFDAGYADIKKAIEMEPLAVEELNEIGKKYFTQKLYKESAAIFELATFNQESKNYLDDNVYYGLALYYGNNKKDPKPDTAALQKADEAFGKVLAASPSYYEAYLFRGRVNSILENDPMTIKYYEAYVAGVTEKGAEELAKPAVIKKITESYNTIGASYANTDKAKAIEYFNKTLVIDPTNAYATASLNTLK
ncbi:tetratricopeptide repeat protein [compost metagenome]